MEQIKRITNNS